MKLTKSKTGLLLIAIFAAIVLWLIGGFLVNKWLGMVCVFVGITIVSLAAGNIMDSPEPSDHK